MQNLEVTTMLLHQVVTYYPKVGNAIVARLFHQKAKEIAHRALAVRDLVFTQELISKVNRWEEER